MSTYLFRSLASLPRGDLFSLQWSLMPRAPSMAVMISLQPPLPSAIIQIHPHCSTWLFDHRRDSLPNLLLPYEEGSSTRSSVSPPRPLDLFVRLVKDTLEMFVKIPIITTYRKIIVCAENLVAEYLL